MFIKPLRLFAKTLSERLSSVGYAISGSEIFYLKGKEWFSLNGDKVSDQNLKVNLSQARAKSSGYQRNSKSTDVFVVPSAFDDAVVSFRKI